MKIGADAFTGRLPTYSNISAVTLCFLVVLSTMVAGISLTGVVTATSVTPGFTQLDVSQSSGSGDVRITSVNWTLNDAASVDQLVVEVEDSTNTTIPTSIDSNPKTIVGPANPGNTSIQFLQKNINSAQWIRVTQVLSDGTASECVAAYDNKGLTLASFTCTSSDSPEPLNVTTSSGSTAFAEGGSAVPVDGDLTINGSDFDSISSAEVSIDEGFQPGADVLSYDSSTVPTDSNGNPTIASSYNAITGVLAFNGSGGIETYQSILRTVTYDNTESPPTPDDRNITFTLTAADQTDREVFYNPATGHYYEYVQHTDVSWSTARSDAENTSYAGLTGYLVTITSEAENDFLVDRFKAGGWIGASDSASEGEWRWVTGPEGSEASGAGREFFDQTAAHVAYTDPYPAPPVGLPGGGSAVNSEYSNWYPRHEPDNKFPFFGGEDYGYLCSGPGRCAEGMWQDGSSTSPNFQSYGYFVEYGGQGKPASTAYTNITASRVVTISFSTADSTPPTADAGANQTVTPGATVTFDGGGSSDDNSISGYEWDVTGNGRSDLTGVTNSTTFANASNYTVTLTVTDVGGNTDTDTMTVFVTDTNAPTAVISGPSSAARGEAITFTGTNSTDDIAIRSFDWDFGDGSTNSTEVSPTHGYDSTGTYTVGLSVTDTAGNTDSTTHDITITSSSRPVISNVSATNPSEQALRMNLTSDMVLDDITVNVYDTDQLTPGSNDSGALQYAVVKNSTIDQFGAPTLLNGNYTYSNLTTVAGGNYTIRVETAANETNGDSGSGQEDTVSIANVDPSGPNITGMTAPGDGVYGLDDTLSFTLTFDEAVTVSGTPSIALDIDGDANVEAANYTSGSGTKTLTFTYTVAAEDTDSNGIAFDQTSIQLNGSTMADSAGNAAATDFSGSASTISGITTDPTTPSVNRLTLGESGGNLTLVITVDEQLGGATSDLAVTVDGPTSGVDWVAFDTSDFSETDNGDGTYNYTLTTTQAYGDGDGTYTVTVDDAVDTAGNNGGENGNGSGLTDTYILDISAPTVSITHPTAGTTYNTSSVALNVTSDESVVWNYSVDGGSNTSFTPNTTIAGLSDGSHTVVVYAMDDGGNVGSSSVTVTIDTSAPTPIILSPTAPDSGSSVALNVTADESITSWSYTLDGGSNQSFTPNSTISSLGEGSHTITVYATDSGGNVGTASVTFTTDTTAPSVTIADPDATSYNVTSIALNVSADDSIVGWNYSLDGGATNIPFTPNTTLTGFDDGSHTITVYAIDDGDNVGSASTTFSVDTANPDLTIVSPTAGVHNSSSLALNVSANESIASWAYRVDGGSNTSFTPNSTITGLSDGSHNITVYATDAAGNTAAKSVTVTVDTTTPTPTILTPESGPTLAPDDVSLNVTADESNTTWTYRIDEGTETSFTPNTTLAGLSTGSYTVTVNVTDAAGNTGTTAVSFTVDGDTPAITVHEPQTGGEYNTSSVALNVSANETVDTWTYSVDGGLNQSFTPNVTLTGLGDGSHNITVYATDAAGNVASETVSFTVDTTDPNISTFTLAATGDGTTLTVKFTSDEQLSKLTIPISGPESTNFTRSNFSVSGSGPYTYTASFTVTTKGDYTAMLEAAIDASGNDAGDDRTDEAQVEIAPTNGGSTGGGESSGVTPPPSLSASATSLDFGSQFTGTTTTRTVSFSNTGGVATDIESVTITGSEADQFTVTDGSMRLEAGETDTVTVAFEPTRTGVLDATLTVTGDDGISTSVALDGTGKTTVTVGNESVTFENVPVGETQTRYITIAVPAGAPGPVTITAADLVGGDISQYDISNIRTPFIIHPGESVKIPVTFTPSSAGEKSATLRIYTDAPATSAIDIAISNGQSAVIVRPLDAETPSVNIVGIRVDADEFLDLNTSTTKTLSTDIAVETLEFTVLRSGNFTMNLSHSDAPIGDDWPAFSGAERVALKHIQLTHTVSNRDLEDTAVRFRVQKSRLGPTGSGPDDVVFYRYDGVRWVAMPTELQHETASAYHYRSETPGFSKFLVTSPQYDVAVLDATLDRETTRPDEAVTATATVRNTKSTAASITLSLNRNSTAIDQRSVTLAANETRTVTFTMTVDTPGTYSISVNDVDAGVLVVQSLDDDELEDPERTPDSSHNEPGDSDHDDSNAGAGSDGDSPSPNADVTGGDSPSIPGPPATIATTGSLTGILFGVSGLLLLLFIYRRRDDEEESTDEFEH